MSLTQYHPLQRLPSPARGFSAILHTAGLASFVLSYRYLIVTPNPINASFGWHLQFLTIIGLTLSTLTFTLALLADVTLSPKLFYAKNTLAVASAPLELLISLLYWSLRAIDPKLVVPEFAPQLAPTADLAFHFVPSVVMLIDILFLSPPWTINVVSALRLSSVIAVGYWFWIEECFRHNGYYPYPLFEMVGYEGRLGLFVMSAVVMTLGTMGMRSVYARINGKDLAGRKKKQ